MPAGGRWPERSRRLPGRGATRGRSPFGATWWGRAWVDALEHRARLDPNRLPRGRTYARAGAVEKVEIAKGQVSALVQGSRSTPYKVRVTVRQFSDGEWEAVLDTLSAQAGRTAALLDGELPTDVAEELRAVDLELLPGPGSLKPSCSCPDWAAPCKHAAAVCYLVSDALDEDPFALFLMRGRSRRELMAALRARRAGAMAASPAPESPAAGRRGAATGLPTMRASQAWERVPAELPRLPLPPRSPGFPTVLDTDPPEGSGVTAAGLRMLAADAAERAWALATGVEGGGLDIEHEADLARWAERIASTGYESPKL